MSGVKKPLSQVGTLQSSARATRSAPAADTGMAPAAGAPARRGPRAENAGTMASAAGGAMAVRPGQARTTKRIALVHGLAPSTTSAASGLPPREMIQQRADTTFAQMEQILLQKVTDTRRGTTQLFTLPEFFWNDFGSNLSQDDKAFALAYIQQKAQNPVFENAVFALGSIVSSEPSEHMASLTQADVRVIAEQLGMEPDHALAIHAEALTTRSESFSEGPPLEMVQMTAVSSLAAARGGDHGEAIREAAADIQLIKEHETALAMVAGFGSPDSLKGDNLKTLMSAEGAEAQRAALNKLCPHVPKEAMRDLRALKALVQATGGDRKRLGKLASAYKKHMLPFKFCTLPTDTGKVPARNMKKDRSMFYVQRSRKEELSPRVLQDAGRTMFKTMHNEAIMLEGGSEPRLVKKFAPSDIDDPAYTAAKPETLSDKAPPFAHRYRLAPGNTHPGMSEQQMAEKLGGAGFDPAQNLYHSERHQLDIGVVVCRDIITDHFQASVSGAVSQADIFQLLSAGIGEGDFRKNLPSQDALHSQNDGIRAEGYSLSGQTKTHAPSLLFRSPDVGGRFEKVGQGALGSSSADWRQGGPGHYSVASETFHLRGRGESRASSFDGTGGPHELEHLDHKIQSYESKLKDLARQEHDRIDVLLDLRSDPVNARRTAESLLPISPQELKDWASGEQKPKTILANIEERIKADAAATQALLEQAQARKAELGGE